MNKKYILITLLLGTLLLLIFLTIFFLSRVVQPTTPHDIHPTPTLIQTISITGKPDSTLEVPTNSPEEGGGVDLEADRTQQSIQEIEKIRPYLPYYETLSLSTGIDVDVSIPNNLVDARPWILTVYINGIDFQIPENLPAYDLYRTSFREAAGKTLTFLQENGVNTSLVFINWGNESYVQERAEQWLTE